MICNKILIQNFKKLALLYCLFVCFEMFSIPGGAITIVYALRISATTKIISDKTNYHSGIGFTTFEQARWNRDDFSKSNAVGELVSCLYVKHPVYLRVDSAFARVSELNNCKPFSRIQTDDILLTTGYGWKFSNTKCSLSGILGIPTHKDTSLEHVQFGLAHVGLGTQFDFAINYLLPKDYFIRGIIRFIGTIPRRVKLQCKNYNFNFGNFIDLLVSHYARFGDHDFELGYNSTLAFGAGISPSILSMSSNTILYRNGCYATYGYTILSKKVLNVFRFGISFSSDSLPKLIGQKLITTGWFVWGIAF